MAAQAITLARPYARAAFELAHAADKLTAWLQALDVAAMIVQEPRIAALAGDPRMLPEQLAALCLPPAWPAESVFAHFLGELVHRRRLLLLPVIAELFADYKRQLESRFRVKVTSAIALDQAQTEQLRTSLEHRFKREVDLEVQTDASLLGGVLIDTGSEVIDDTIRGRLARLANALMR